MSDAEQREAFLDYARRMNVKQPFAELLYHAWQAACEWMRQQAERGEPPVVDEVIRRGVQIIKHEFTAWRDPPVYLPSDSVIERCVRYIVQASMTPPVTDEEIDEVLALFDGMKMTSRLEQRMATLLHQLREAMARDEHEISRLRDWIHKALNNTPEWQECVARSKLPAAEAAIASQGEGHE